MLKQYVKSISPIYEPKDGVSDCSTPTTAEAEALKKERNAFDENLADGKVDNQRYANWVYCSKRREKCSFLRERQKKFQSQGLSYSPLIVKFQFLIRRRNGSKSDFTWLAEQAREAGKGLKVRAQTKTI